MWTDRDNANGSNLKPVILSKQLKIGALSKIETSLFWHKNCEGRKLKFWKCPTYALFSSAMLSAKFLSSPVSPVMRMLFFNGLKEIF